MYICRTLNFPMVRHTLKVLQNLLQSFESVFNNFGTLCIKVLKIEIGLGSSI